MASTSVTTVGGVMIVTQVIPKDGASIPLQAPVDPVPQAPPPTLTTPPPVTKKGRTPAEFLQGQQQGVGVVQILIGILCVLFALSAVYTPPLIIYAPFGLGVVFVVSGGSAAAAGRRTSTRLLCVSMWSNVLSVLLGLVGVVYLCLLFARTSPYEMICSFLTRDMPPTSPAPTTTTTTSSRWNRPRYPTPPRTRCPQGLSNINEVLYGLQGLFLVLLVLQVCVSVSVCVLSGRILKRCKNYSQMTVETDCSSLLPPGSPEACNQNRPSSEEP